MKNVVFPKLFITIQKSIEIDTKKYKFWNKLPIFKSLIFSKKCEISYFFGFYEKMSFFKNLLKSIENRCKRYHQFSKFSLQFSFSNLDYRIQNSIEMMQKFWKLHRIQKSMKIVGKNTWQFSRFWFFWKTFNMYLQNYLLFCKISIFKNYSKSNNLSKLLIIIEYQFLKYCFFFKILFFVGKYFENYWIKQNMPFCENSWNRSRC